MLPSPVPVEASTDQVVPEPVTAVRLAPATPVELTAKSEVSTPVTLSEKVTVKKTDPRRVGEAPVRVMELTEGGVESSV
jgi:hypothetical protein